MLEYFFFLVINYCYSTKQTGSIYLKHTLLQLLYQSRVQLLTYDVSGYCIFL